MNVTFLKILQGSCSAPSGVDNTQNMVVRALFKETVHRTVAEETAANDEIAKEAIIREKARQQRIQRSTILMTGSSSKHLRRGSMMLGNSQNSSLFSGHMNKSVRPIITTPVDQQGEEIDFRSDVLLNVEYRPESGQIFKGLIKGLDFIYLPPEHIPVDEISSDRNNTNTFVMGAELLHVTPRMFISWNRGYQQFSMKLNSQ